MTKAMEDDDDEKGRNNKGQQKTEMEQKCDEQQSAAVQMSGKSDQDERRTSQCCDSDVTKYMNCSDSDVTKYMNCGDSDVTKDLDHSDNDDQEESKETLLKIAAQEALLGSGVKKKKGDAASSPFATTTDTVDALPSRLKYSNFDLLCTVVSMLTYLFDLVMDCMVAFYFYHLGVSHGVYHYWYCALTLTFIILPSLTMTGFSLRWYLMDADNSDLPKVPLWRWIVRVVALMLQFAPILRYIDSVRYGLLSRKAEGQEKAAAAANDHIGAGQARQRRLKYYTLMVYEDADATLLRLFECFMESAPQLVLQIYILIKDPMANKVIATDVPDITTSGAGDGGDDATTTTGNDDLIQIPGTVIKSTILCVSVVSSLVSLAWSLVVYHRSLRYTYPEKKNLDWRGSTFQFLWHFSSITARVIALSLFASIFPGGIFLVCAGHWAVMTTWVALQGTQACNTRCEEFVFSCVLGAIYIFSFFNAKEERTRYKYLVYYSFCFCENTALIAVWIMYAAHHDSYQRWYFYPGIVGHYLAFFTGLAFMMIYYGFFHPSEIKRFSFKATKRQRPFVTRSAPSGKNMNDENLFYKGLRRISNLRNNANNQSGINEEESQIERPIELKVTAPPVDVEGGAGVEGGGDGGACAAAVGGNRPATSLSGGGGGKISPSLSSPAELDAQDSSSVSGNARSSNSLQKSASMPAKSMGIPLAFKLQPPRSIKAMGSVRTLRSNFRIDELHAPHHQETL